MRYAITLAAIPLPLLMWTAWPASQPIVVRAVPTEGVRAQRMDANTFRLRWSVVSDLPPAVAPALPRGMTTTGRPMLSEGGSDLESFEHRRNGSRLAADEVPVRTASVPPPARLVRRAALRVNDICTRHGMRKVEYSRRGYKHWRCRR